MKCLWISFFSLAALYAGDKEAPISSLWRVDNSIVTTECKSLSTMQAHFKNLYFDSDKHTFYTVDKKVDIRKAINLVENRGYKWKSDRSSKDKNQFVIPKTTIIFFEKPGSTYHSSHFFHFMEHCLPIWNFGAEKLREDVVLFVMAGDGKEYLPGWKGENELVYHIIKALFPHAIVKNYQQFFKEMKRNVVRFESVITSDRSMEVFKKEPYCTERMLGGYFQNLTKSSLDHLAECIWNYFGIEKTISDKVRITYLVRQHTTQRYVDPYDEKELLDAIKNLPNIELKVVDFATISFKEQVEMIASTDILLGAHGNGLTHTLFLRDGATLIELFPPDAYRVEYRILAKARGIQYFSWIDRSGWLDDQNLDNIYAHGNVNQVIHIDVPSIVSLIQEIELLSKLR